MDTVSKGHSYRRFKSWLLICAALIVPLFIALGLWQLERAAQKQVLLEQWQRQSSTQHPRALDESGLQTFDVVSHVGHLDIRRWYLLDNRTRQGRAGYEVIAVFYPEQMDAGVLVNLGWVAAGADRNALPQLALPSQRIAIRGRLSEPSKLLVLRADPPATGWPRRIQYLDTSLMGRDLGVSLLPWLLRADKPVLPDADLSWSPVAMRPVKHTAYALQWFAMALMLGLMTVWSWWQSGRGRV